MRIIVIPDIHGRKFWREVIEDNLSKVDKVVFLGDYFDPYNESNLEEDMIIMMEHIIKLKLNEPDKYILLIGNHDCHYIWNNYPRSTRYNNYSSKDYHKIFCDNLTLFNIGFIQDNTIFTHAGITEEWKNLCFPELSILELGKKLASEKLNENALNFGYLAAISFYRGGFAEAGSCEWADIREHIDMDNSIKEVVPKGEDGVYQIFGHTQLKEPLITDKWACLDCKKGFIVDTITHEISEC